MTPDAVGGEERDVGDVADAVRGIAEDARLPGRFRVSLARTGDDAGGAGGAGGAAGGLA